jgi:hypothetical protein
MIAGQLVSLRVEDHNVNRAIIYFAFMSLTLADSPRPRI